MFGINQGGTHLHYHSMHQPSYTLLPKHYYLTTTYLLPIDYLPTAYILHKLQINLSTNLIPRTLGCTLYIYDVSSQ